MPVYEFACRDCGKNFEVVQKISDAGSAAACPGCGSRNVERIWSSVYAITAKKS